MEILVTVAEKVANVVGAPCIVCGNSDYTINFAFDSEWDDYEIKTARFSYVRDGERGYIDVPFSGESCAVPVLVNIAEVKIGVYAGDLHTSTPAKISCKRSILCDDGLHEDPPIDVYSQLVETIKTSNGRNIFVSIDDDVATINAKYNDSQDISVKFGKHGPNNVPEFLSFAFVDNATLTTSSKIDAPIHYVNTSDCFAPYDVAALNDIDGDMQTAHTSESICGGNHAISNGTVTVPTAKNNYMRFYADGMPIASGNCYCSKLRIDWENDVMAWNTVKADGTGRYILTETISMIFDGVRWDVEKIITSKEDTIRIKSHHGLQFLLRYCDRYIGYARFLGSDTNKEKIPTDRRNYTTQHAADATNQMIYCDDKQCDTIMIADDTNAVQFGLMPYGLGRNNDCKYERGDTEKTISSAYVSTAKAYFNPIWYKGDDDAGIPYGVELKKDESVYLRGFYRFYPADATKANEVYPITTILTNVTQKDGEQTYVSKRSEAYLNFMAEEGYTLPSSVTVTGATKSWAVAEDEKTASLLLIAPTGDITVTIVGVPATTTSYSISIASQNLIAADSNPTTISEGGTAELLFTSPTKYSLPETVSVTNATYVWDKYNGKLTISNPTGNVLIIASGASGETWEIIESPSASMMENMKMQASGEYTANNETFNRFYITTTAAGRTSIKMYTYGDSEQTQVYYSQNDPAWIDEGYRTIKLEQAAGDMLTWLTANAKKL